jgi:purine nucleoside permease
MPNRLAALACALGLATATAAAGASGNPSHKPPIDEGWHAPKVMIITMFAPERQTWIDNLGPWHDIRVPGLSPDYPVVSCNHAGVCVLTTGMGHANAAASTTALVLSHVFDLSHTYFLVAGIAGIAPAYGTVGTAAWARWLVDFGLQWEIDAREIPAGWSGGYLGINTQNPDQKPPLDYRTEVFRLNEALLQKAYALSRNQVLSDNDTARAWRAHYPDAPANQPPTVVQCDTVAGDTWFSGTLLGERATKWTQILTDGQGVYCTTQQEDNATYEALLRGASAHLLDPARVAVLRAGSDFDRPYPGLSAGDNLLQYGAQGGFTIALQNLFIAGNPLVQAITCNWAAWRRGVPAAE